MRQSVVNTNESIDERVVGGTSLKDAQRSTSKIIRASEHKSTITSANAKATQARCAA